LNDVILAYHSRGPGGAFSPMRVSMRVQIVILELNDGMLVNYDII